MRQALALLEALVALVVEEDLDKMVVQVVQEMIRQQVQHKDLMVVVLLQHLDLQNGDVAVAVELLKQGWMVLLRQVAEEVQVEQLVFQQVQ